MRQETGNSGESRVETTGAQQLSSSSSRDRLCPRDRQALSRQELHGVEVDVCHECDGVWLDPGEIETIAPGFVTHGLHSPARALPRSYAVLRCPGCNGDLIPQYYGRGIRRLELDFCIQCGGLWLDLSPLKHLSRSAREVVMVPPKTDAAPVRDDGRGRGIGLPRRAREWFVALTGMPLDVGNPCSIIPYVTWMVIAVNVVVFACQWLVVERPEMLVHNYGLIPEALARGEFHRLFTSMFLHVGVFHLAGNLFFLYTFGDNLEERYGGVAYLLLYLACGVAAGLMSGLVVPQGSEGVPRIGASGAISGVLGAYLVTFPRTRILMGILFLRFIPLVFHWPVWFFLLVWIGLNAAGLALQTADHYAVDYIAHLGGFAAGLVAGLLLVLAHDAALEGAEA